MTRHLDHLVGALFEGIVVPEKLPDALALLAGWLEQSPKNNLADSLPAMPPPYCPHGLKGETHAVPCQGFQPMQGFSQGDEAHCVVCLLFDGKQLNWHRVVELVMHGRALREFAEHSVSQQGQASHVAVFVLAPTGGVVDCDSRAHSLLKAGDVLRLSKGLLCCVEQKFQVIFNSSLSEAIESGRPKNILIHKQAQPGRRFSLSLTPMRAREDMTAGGARDSETKVLCLVAPLDGRRIATARQLMELFGLSAAEARLARAICHGSSVEEYAHDQGVRLSTVRTQLSAVLHKTGSERQAGLVRLIAGIPVIRDLA